jgi:hypothetical protein
VLVVVVTMLGVPVLSMDVVHMVAMLYGRVPAVRRMDVVVRLSREVSRDVVLVVVVAVEMVGVAVVQVVDVVVVLDAGVAAARSVDMRVVGVDVVRGAHAAPILEAAMRGGHR